MVFEKVLVTKKEELLLYKKSIFALFRDTFKQDLDESLWSWAYMDNPNGDPIVSLYFDSKKLIGHYAIIPINLLNENTKQRIKAALSMTTMVDISYRKYGVFILQAQEVYKKAISLNYQLVYGFPNKKSAPGFKKRLEWILEDDLYVATLTQKELLNITICTTMKYSIVYNILDSDQLRWRLNKPYMEYIKINNTILKRFENNFDIIFNANEFSYLENTCKYNILLEHYNNYRDKKQFDYVFGYRIFDSALEIRDFKKDLIMSDLF